MEQERPASRGSSIFSDETIDAERPPSRALSDDAFDNDFLFLFPERQRNELENLMDWFNNMEVPAPQAAEVPPLQAAEVPPQAAEVDDVQGPDSSSDWVVAPPLPLEDHTGPADSTSWWNNN
jgi:hypothetical protein